MQAATATRPTKLQGAADSRPRNVFNSGGTSLRSPHQQDPNTHSGSNEIIEMFNNGRSSLNTNVLIIVDHHSTIICMLQMRFGLTCTTVQGNNGGMIETEPGKVPKEIKNFNRGIYVCVNAFMCVCLCRQ